MLRREALPVTILPMTLTDQQDYFSVSPDRQGQGLHDSVLLDADGGTSLDTDQNPAVDLRRANGGLQELFAPPQLEQQRLSFAFRHERRDGRGFIDGTILSPDRQDLVTRLQSGRLAPASLPWFR